MLSSLNLPLSHRQFWNCKHAPWPGLALTLPAPGGRGGIGGGIPGATGYRYWTLTIHNLDEVLSAVEAAGHKIVRPRTEVGPGGVIGMVEDPDGKRVEFIQAQ
jgi:predicted enzyme related to lactoylglutathione lyase